MCVPGAKLARRRVADVLIAVDEHDARAFPLQALGDRPSDTPGAARNQCHTIRELAIDTAGLRVWRRERWFHFAAISSIKISSELCGCASVTRTPDRSSSPPS